MIQEQIQEIPTLHQETDNPNTIPKTEKCQRRPSVAEGSVSNTTKIKTIQYQSIPIKNRSHFLSHLQKNVHEFALFQQSNFSANNTNAQYFHKDKQSTEKFPVLIHALEIDGLFALRAYTQNGIATLDHYNQLFTKQFPEHHHQYIEINETSPFKQTVKPLIYESQNWIPFRACQQKNGLYYDIENDTIANFESRLKGNIITFLNRINTNKLTFKTKLLQIKPNQLITALNANGKPIKKQTFHTKISIDLQLPSIFSIGQNPAFGNGVFKRLIN